MSKLKKCPACEHEISKKVKKCPNCGEQVKTGFFVKVLTGILIIGVLGMIFSPSKEEEAQQLAAYLQGISEAQAENINPAGKISDAFSLGSQYTDIQRENMIKEIKGKIVHWTLPVYEVDKRKDGIYRIQTKSGTRYVGTFINLYARNADEVKFIESLKTGNNITFKGKISGVILRNITIDSAILIYK